MSMTFNQLVGGVQTRLRDGDGTGAGTDDVRFTLTEKRAAVNFAIQRFCRDTEYLRQFVTWTQDSGAVYKPGSSVKVKRLLEDPQSATLGYRLTLRSAAWLFDNDAAWLTTEGDPLYYAFPYAVVGDVKKLITTPVRGTALTDIKGMAVVIPADLVAGDAGVLPAEFDEGTIDGAVAYLLGRKGQAGDLDMKRECEATFAAAIQRGQADARDDHSNVATYDPPEWC